MKGVHSLGNLLTDAAALELTRLKVCQPKTAKLQRKSSQRKEHYAKLFSKIECLNLQQVFGKNNFVYNDILIASQGNDDLTVYIPKQAYDELKELLQGFTYKPRVSRVQRDRSSRLIPDALRYCSANVEDITALEIINRVLNYLNTIDFDSIDHKPIDFLPNFTSKHIGILKDLNIYTDKQLEDLGPYEAFDQMKVINKKLTYTVLYRIYGALNSRFYLDLSNSEKSELVHNYLEFKYRTSKQHS